MTKLPSLIKCFALVLTFAGAILLFSNDSGVESIPHIQRHLRAGLSDLENVLWWDRPIDASNNQEGRFTAHVDAQHVSLVISYCAGDLGWLKDFSAGFHFDSVSVFSKCGKDVQPRYLPESNEVKVIRLPNVGGCDHTYAHWIRRYSKNHRGGDDERDDDDDDGIVVFLKDNLRGREFFSGGRTAEGMIRAASARGVGCQLEPRGRSSVFHRTDDLMRFKLKKYSGNAGIGAFSPSEFANLGEWVDRVNITLPRPFARVCYGGNFAVRLSNILSVPSETWAEMEKSLSRANNLEEGHYAERTWASLLRDPLTAEEIDAIERVPHGYSRVPFLPGLLVKS